MIICRRFVLLFALVLALVAPSARGGDIVVDFNNLTYPNGPFDPNEGFPVGQAPGTGSYDNGWNLNGGFTSNGAFFSNSYDTTFHSWSGWAYSDVNVNHQFAAITGTAPGGSGNYAISTGPGAVINLPSGTSPVSFEVTNTTYSYLSMTLGDSFATKFTIGSFFELKIFGFSGLNGMGTEVGEVDFFLANYSSASSLPVNVWTLVDLSSLANAQSLTFDYASSDVGEFGINTPEFFAMDDLVLSTTSVPEPSSWLLCLSGVGLTLLSSRMRNRRQGGRNRRAPGQHGVFKRQQ
jgi:Domain of unknown function (DUF4465)